MAIAVLSQADVKSGNPQVSTLSLGAPAGLNATMLDLIVAACVDSGDGSNPITVSNDGTAYTLIATGNLDQTGMQGDYASFRKTGASSPGSVTIGHPGPYPRRGLAARFALTGVDLTGPIEAQSAALTEGTAPDANPFTLTVPAITTLTNGSMVIAVVAASQAGTWADVAGWTIVYQGVSYTSSYAPSFVVYRKTIVTAGTSGNLPAVFTQDPILSDTGYNLIGGMFAIKSDGTSGGGGPGIIGARATASFGL